MTAKASALIHRRCHILIYKLRRCLNLLVHEGKRLFTPHPRCSWQQTIFVIRTHLLSESFFNLYTKCVEEFGSDRVLVCFDETNRPLDEHIACNQVAAKILRRDCIITVSDTLCLRISPLHRTAMYSAAAHVVLSAAGAHKAFRFLWLIEGDVYCHGSIKQCLQPTLRSDADFLAKPTEKPIQQAFRTPDTNPKWPWWGSLQGDIAKTPLSERKGCFFPIIRCSKDFIRLLESNLTKSSGYCEIYFPTLCHTYGLRLSLLPTQMFGAFRYRPPVGYQQIITNPDDNRLYHPVKSFAS
jgi:hypothetical protein